MTILLSPETETRLTAEASRRGIPTNQLVEQLIVAALPKIGDSASNPSSMDIVNAREAEKQSTDLPQDAQPQVEFEDGQREIINILSRSYYGGETDLAERHNEHQP